ncbi:MAG: hypothetical protein A3H94_01560 [Acidobacteria bacterium RIFCSPLOWO2_02_FULL_60_20]|nr:MAG: hypothetical protein A3H94_01560 [Acidobacteria bacterium RIFCSPLOWO2_02_FULL_60_20]
MAKSLRIRVKRVYDLPAREDGKRYLVDRLWPRGLSKDRARLDGWLKEIAPSDALRRWFGHDAARWQEFQRRYFAELDEQPELCRELFEQAQQGNVTLLYSACDPEHNNAVALNLYLEQQSSPHRPKRKRAAIQ